MFGIAALEDGPAGKALALEQLLGETDHLVGDVDAEDLSLRTNGLGNFDEAVPRAEADFENLLARLCSELLEPRLAHRFLGFFGKQVVDFGKLVVILPGHFFGLQNAKHARLVGQFGLSFMRTPRVSVNQPLGWWSKMR